MQMSNDALRENPKHQDPKSKQTPTCNRQVTAQTGWGAWSLDILWFLDLGVWCLSTASLPVFTCASPLPARKQPLHVY